MSPYALQYFIVTVADVYSMMLFVYVLMSWIPQKNGIIGDIDTILGRLCDPFLNLFRRFIPPIGGVMDISPIVALIVLQFAVRLIVSIL